MPKHFLVTGGTGFLGSALVRRLLATGNRVRVLDDDSRGRRGRLADVAASCEFVGGDVRDPDVVRRAARGVDSVCHLAFVNGTGFFYTKPDVVLDVGVRGMINVLDACRANDVGELVLASSSEVYQTPPTVPTDEAAPLSIPDPLNPRYSYAGGKLISELLTIHCGKPFLDRVLIFRPHNVYGPDMGEEHVVPQFIRRMQELVETHPGAGTLPFAIQGTGDERRAFCYVDDFTDGLMRVIEAGEHLNIYHIGSPTETRIADLARAVAAAFGRDIEIEPGPLARGGTARRCPDISKLAALGYSPRVSLAQGLSTTIGWYRANAPTAIELQEQGCAL